MKGVLVSLIVGTTLGVLGAPPVSGDVDPRDWREQKRKLKVWYRATEPADFKTDVDNAMAKWNAENTGWLFNAGTESDHNVEVKLGQTGDANTSGKCEHSLWNGDFYKCVITINKNGVTGPRQRVITHELGHAIRLNHVKDDKEDDGDIMEPRQSANEDNLEPTANDVKEAKDAAATDKKKAESDPKSKTENQMQPPVAITPVPGVAFNLDQALTVEITGALGAGTLLDIGTPIWGPCCDEITVDMTPLPGANHNECYTIHVEYVGGTSADFDSCLIVAETPPPTGMFPHAVVPAEASVEAGEAALVDGTGSFHDAGAPIVFAWVIDGSSTQQGGSVGYFELLAGDHTVNLEVEDEWGEIDTAATIVHVAGGGIPTVSEWGVFATGLLMLVGGSLVFARRKAVAT